VSWKGLSLVSSCGIKKQVLSKGFVVRNLGGWKVMFAPTMYLQFTYDRRHRTIDITYANLGTTTIQIPHLIFLGTI
jgi:hypothetical protein